MEQKPKERIVFDEWPYYGSEGEEVAIDDLMARDDLTEDEVRESYTERRASEERVTLKEEAESSREAADSLSAERTSEEPNRDAPAIE